MILYKGNSLVVGKHFMYENSVLQYQGKVFGSFFEFIDKNGVKMIFNESELSILKEYSVDNKAGLRDYFKDFTDKVGTLQPLTKDKFPELLQLLNDCKTTLESSDLVNTSSYSSFDIDKDKFSDFFINYIRNCNLNLDNIRLNEFYSYIVSSINLLNSIL